VIEKMNDIHGPGGWVFQDDGASPHRARFTKGWLDERCRNLTSGELPWPANSPDLNPIEQMWVILKEGMDREGCTTREELFRRAQTAREAMSVETINAAIESSPVRLHAVQALHGQPLNGHREVLKALRHRLLTIVQVQERRESQRTALEAFVSQRRCFFEDQFGTMIIDQWVAMASYSIVCLLPKAIVSKMRDAKKPRS
jgi:hypothetical protein